MVTVRNKCSSSSSQPLSKLPLHPDNNCLPFYRERLCCQKKKWPLVSLCIIFMCLESVSWWRYPRLSIKVVSKTEGSPDLSPAIIGRLELAQQGFWRTGHGPMDVPCFAKAHKWPWQRCCSQFLSLLGDRRWPMSFNRPAAKMEQQSPPPPR